MARDVDVQEIVPRDAGSDVASIRTRAVRVCDDRLINGRKLFITNGVPADWAYLLARTSKEGRGHRGMSQIIVPTAPPGFTASRAAEAVSRGDDVTRQAAGGADEVMLQVLADVDRFTP